MALAKLNRRPRVAFAHSLPHSLSLSPSPRSPFFPGNGSWALVREARDESWPKCTFFRVHTVYNKKTALYVMWAK